MAGEPLPAAAIPTSHPTSSMADFNTHLWIQSADAVKYSEEKYVCVPRVYTVVYQYSVSMIVTELLPERSHHIGDWKSSINDLKAD